MYKVQLPPPNSFTPPTFMASELAPPSLKTLTPKEVQEKLKISRATMYGREKKGDTQYRSDFPKSFKEGGLRRFYEHEVEAYLWRLGANR